MSSFTSKLEVSPMPDGSNWLVCKAFTYRIGKKYSRRFIRVPKGFETDFASIPKPLLIFLPDWAKINKAPVLHDWLYQEKKIMGKPIIQKQADDIFLEAMLVGWHHHKFLHPLIAHLEYRVVRLFGWMAWRRKPKTTSDPRD